MSGYFECWIRVAATLFSQALAGEPKLIESIPQALDAEGFGFECTLAGDIEGRFQVLLDPALLQTALLGEGVNQRTGWKELLREIADAAAGDMLPREGKKCHVDTWKEAEPTGPISQAFQIKSATAAWTLQVRDDTHPSRPAEAGPDPNLPQRPSGLNASEDEVRPTQNRSGLELLLDVELEAALRFGCRELPLGEILDLGAGDVVELDRHVSDPVDLVVGDRIVARGEVVLVNGNFGLRVTEVAAPRKRLESIRCLF
ncbi:MAG TPA: FliM/FliN family flagellar motor switch protein [Terracidiphilus sp.]|jgi:flagellar motor switch protein FliN|nr:FliM/FliN family flagellar motor switch protein [Terracidiphilus sp.]